MPQNNGIRLLALDGGGIRGLSSLLILKRLMTLVDPRSPCPPKPCEYFHMIGGTSTGGIIAIMLGRLRMTVDECIDAYTSLSDKVFQKTNHRISMKGDVQGRFDAGTLEQAIKTVIAGCGLAEESLLRDDDAENNPCKVFVCAMSKQTSKIVCLTSYPPVRGSQHHLVEGAKIWEACRATSAATSFFDPISMGPFQEEFVDGALGANNPVNFLWSQAQDIWGPAQLERRLQCLVSIGTGIPSIKPLDDDLRGLSKSLIALSTETEATAEQFRRDKFHLVNEGRYFRFNVTRGLEDVGLEETRKKREIASATAHYIDLQDVFERLHSCAEKLKSFQEYGTGTSQRTQAIQDSSPEELLETSLRNLHESFDSDIKSVGFVDFPTSSAMFSRLNSELHGNQEGPNMSRLLACTHKVDTFATAFRHYIGFLGLFTKIRDRYSGAIWGMIRLIFVAGEYQLELLEIISDRFLEVAFKLKVYERNLDTFGRRNVRGVEYVDFANLTALVYVDLLELCQEVYNMFAPEGKGPYHRKWHRLLWGTTWEPFEDRFSNMRERLLRGEKIVEERAFNHSTWASKLEIAFWTHLRREDEKTARRLKNENDEQGRAAGNEIEKHAGELQSWLFPAAEELKSAYDLIADTRLPKTCEWFLERREYKNWRDGLFKRLQPTNVGPSTVPRRGPDWRERLLSVQAKPGFGKTVLSSAVVHDLEKHISGLPTSGSQMKPAVAFYYYGQSNRSSGSTPPIKIFHPLASQLVSIHREDWGIMDAVTLLQYASDKRRFGSYKASISEAEAIRRLVLHKAPAFLLVDGIDECPDTDVLLSTIWQVLTSTQCHVILFGRPEVHFPVSFKPGPWASWNWKLGSADNTAAIRSMLADALPKLANEGFVSRSYQYCQDEEHISQIAKRADGMFLWARLLIMYLRCPALSPSERELTLERATMIQGLGDLYNRILSTLGGAYPEQIKTAGDIFQWVSTAVRPLTQQELRIALAITPGRPTLDGALLANWPACISEITRSLVDVDKSGSVRLIHLSFQEFLEKDPTCHPAFFLGNTEEFHARMGTACISYLVYDVPAAPIATWHRSHAHMQSVDTASLIKTSHPFLEYTSAYWPVHLGKASPSRRLSPTPHAGPFIPPISPLSPYSLPHHPSAASPSAVHSTSLYGAPPSRGMGMESLMAPLHNNPRAYSPPNPNAFPATSFSYPPTPFQQPPWSAHLSIFLLNRQRVTAWVEACWTLTRRPPPDLSQAISTLSAATTTMNNTNNNPMLNNSSHSQDQGGQQLEGGATIELREMAWILAGLGQLSSALRELASPHPAAAASAALGKRAASPHILLSEQPAAIWTSQIVSATDPDFWPVLADFPQ